MTPLAASVARLDADFAWATFAYAPADPGWARCADVLASSGVRKRWRAHVAEALVAEHRTADDIVVAASMLLGYADVVGWLAAALFCRERRVPRIGPHDLAFRLPRGRSWPYDVALLDPRFDCLPTDADAGCPSATVVPSEKALAARLHEQLSEHAGRFLTVFDAGVRLSSRTRWGAFSDVLDTAPWAAGSLTGNAEAGIEAARLLLTDAPTPLFAGSRIYRDLDDLGRPLVSRHRLACCFLYRVPGHGACFVCPRTSDAERATRAAQAL